MTHIVYSHWLAGYPVGTRCHSVRMDPQPQPITAADLHKVLGDRRDEAFRPDESADTLTRIECLINNLRRAG